MGRTASVCVPHREAQPTRFYASCELRLFGLQNPRLAQGSALSSSERQEPPSRYLGDRGRARLLEDLCHTQSVWYIHHDAVYFVCVMQ